MNSVLEHRYLRWIVFGLLAVFIAVRCAMVPFAHDEVATFYFYIQPGSFFPFVSHIDANGHFLTSALGWLCFKAFGSSPFVLRLPSLFAFLVLCLAVYRFQTFFRSWISYVSFAGSLLAVFTFVSFFSLCRGYGISMAFFVLALYYLFSFVADKNVRHHHKFLLFIQVALAANLTLLFVALICTALLILVRLAARLPWTINVILVYILHFSLIVFWTCYAFYLREHGALYYGAGESYWKVTFVSLITILFGDSFLVIGVVLGLLLFVAIVCLSRLRSMGLDFLTHPAALSFFLLCTLVVMFYLLKIIAGVNYPEDRTGLFFYPLFVIAVFAAADVFLRGSWRYLSALPAAGAVACAAVTIDLSTHPYQVYETMPARFYQLLANEQRNSNRPITIAGHRVREFIYGFLNYRSDYKLNHMTSPEALQMNCDYALAVKADEPWYRPYYSVLDSDDRWGFRLLKRKEPIVRQPVWRQTESTIVEGEPEYHNFFEIADTAFDSDLPLQAEVTFKFLSASKPFRAWIVFQIDGSVEEDNIFVRAPLDLVAYDWQRENQMTLCLTTGAAPKQIKRMVMYLWNIEKKPLKLQVDSCRLVRLNATGINVTSKAEL